MKEEIKISMVDYGVGNLYSLIRAFQHLGVKLVVTEEEKTILDSDGLILPGVGSFEAGMKGLEMRGLAKTIKKFANQNKPLLGICLGAQLLLTEGHEFGRFDGLDIIEGKVVHFPSLQNQEKVPHVSWNKVYPKLINSWQESIFDSLKTDDRFYFVHSYILEPNQEENAFGFTDYGGHKFCSVVKKGNIYGCQFHPEKSGEAGLKLIKNFVTLVKSNPS